MKMAVFWVVAPCSLVEVYQRNIRVVSRHNLHMPTDRKPQYAYSILLADYLSRKRVAEVAAQTGERIIYFLCVLGFFKLQLYNFQRCKHNSIYHGMYSITLFRADIINRSRIPKG
jgi:hypothetical protein